MTRKQNITQKYIALGTWYSFFVTSNYFRLRVVSINFRTRCIHDRVAIVTVPAWRMIVPLRVFCVAVKPEVEPFPVTDSTLNEGGSTKILCSVSSGDMPMHFVWTKNGLPMNADRKNLRVQQLDEMTSMFSLTRVSLEDAGNYSCIAQNEAGSDSHTASLKVMGKEKRRILNSSYICVFSLVYSR